MTELPDRNFATSHTGTDGQRASTQGLSPSNRQFYRNTDHAPFCIGYPATILGL